MTTAPLSPLDPPSHAWLEFGETQRLLLDGYPGLALSLDAQGRVRWINPAAAQRLGYAREELDGRALAGSLVAQAELEARAAQLSASGAGRIAADSGLFLAALSAGAAEPQSWVLRHKDGSPHAVRLAFGPLRDHRGAVAGVLAVEPPASAADDEDAPLALTHHDSLTGLPTRAVLQDRAEMALLRAARQKTVLALLLIDLGGFDAICEEYGHSVGDDILRATAGRLHFELRKTDTAVRLERSQFAAMLVDLQEAAQARTVADKIVKSLSAPINVGIARLEVRPRIGAVWTPTHGNQLLPMLQVAEAALAGVPSDQAGVNDGPAG
jgi:diguanylate cyclase (GGDEF)-like protein/PAS domain S-box-containing protein